MNGKKKPRRIRWKPTAATISIAISNAAKPAPQDRADILAKLGEAVKSLCTGTGAALDWSVCAGAVGVAKAIERQGIVRGLLEHLDSAETALQAIHNRCWLPKMWLRPTLSIAETDALRLLHELHSYQVNQLGRAEFQAAIDAAIKNNTAQGHTATVVHDLERMAA